MKEKSMQFFIIANAKRKLSLYLFISGTDWFCF